MIKAYNYIIVYYKPLTVKVVKWDVLKVYVER